MLSSAALSLVGCNTDGAGSSSGGNNTDGAGSGSTEGDGNNGAGGGNAEGGDHVCEVPELSVGDNGNWFLGGVDTGVSCKLEITDTSAEIVESVGINYCMVTINFSDGSSETVIVEVPKDNSSFSPSATVTNGFGGANGIICLMTDNDSGKFETLYLLDQLYVKYGLVAGLGTVTKNLYADSSYTAPKPEAVARTQQFLDTGRWKLICHSMTHTSYGSGTGADFVIDEDRLYKEIVTSAELLRELFPGERVLTYAMTGTQSAIGSSTDEYNMREAERALIAEYYIGGRFSYTGPQDFDKLQWNNLPYGMLSTKNLPTLLANIDKAATEGKYYMVYNHYVIEDELIDTVNQSSWTTLSTAEALCERVAKYVSDGSLWCAQFEDAVMYMRERETSTVLATYDKGVIKVLLTDKMDDDIYNHKLTVKITVPDDFEAVKITQGNEASFAEVISNGYERYVLANILPDGGIATLEPISPEDIPEATPEETVPTPDLTKPAIPTPEVPDVYTFDTLDGLLGSFIEFDNQGNERASIAVVTEGDEKLLAFSKAEGTNNPTVNFVAKGAEEATSLVAEMDVRIDRTSSSGEFYINLTNEAITSYAYRMYITASSDGSLKLTDYNNGSGDGKVTTTASLGKKLGDLFRLKIEFTEGDRDSLKILVSVDGTVVHESQNYYTVSGDPLTAEEICKLRINPSAKFTGTVYIDNLTVKQMP